MIKGKFVQLAVLAVGIVLAAPNVALGAYAASPGNACQPGYGSTTIYQSETGAGNPSTTSTNYFVCPIILGVNDYSYLNVNSVYIYYVDTSSTSTFICHVQHTTRSGSLYIGTDKYSCGTNGGCTAATQNTSWTGTNWMYWTGSSLPHGAAFSYSAGDNASIRCDLPPATSGSESGCSWLRGYWAE